MSATREQITHADKSTRDHFTVRWDFVNTFLTHAHVDDPELIVRDLIDLERGLNG